MVFIGLYYSCGMDLADSHTVCGWALCVCGVTILAYIAEILLLHSESTKFGSFSNSLSALIATGIGIILLWACDSSQSLFIAGVLTFLLAQASAMGWYNYVEEVARQKRTRPTRPWKLIVREVGIDAALQKIPDIAAVIGTVFALWYACDGYGRRVCDGSFYLKQHNPMWFGWAGVSIASLGAAFGFLGIFFGLRLSYILFILVAALAELGFGALAMIRIGLAFCGFYRLSGVIAGGAIVLGAGVNFYFVLG